MPTYTERAEGPYVAKYLGCSERTLEDQETKEEVVRWLWRFQDVNDPTTAGEIAKWTGTSAKSANSNAYMLMRGVLGHKPEPGDDTETHTGEVYNVYWGPNQAGNLTITAVSPVRQTASSEAVANAEGTAQAAQEHAAQEDGDQLPF